MASAADAELTAAALELLAARRDAAPCQARLSLLTASLRSSLAPPYAQLRSTLRALRAVVTLRPAARAPLLHMQLAPALLRAATLHAFAADALHVLADLMHAPRATVAGSVPRTLAQLALPLLRAPLLTAHVGEEDAPAAAALRALAALAEMPAFASCRALCDRALLGAVHAALLRAIHTGRPPLVNGAAHFLVALLSAQHMLLRATLNELRMSHLLVRALLLNGCRAHVLRYFAALLKPPASLPELPYNLLLPQLISSLRHAKEPELVPTVQILCALPSHLTSPSALIAPLVHVLPRIPSSALPSALSLLANLLSGNVQVAKHAHTALAARSLSEAARPHTDNFAVMHPTLVALKQLIHCYDRNRAAVVAANLPQLVLLVLVKHVRQPNIVAAAAKVFILLSPADLRTSEIDLDALSKVLQARLALHSSHAAAAPAVCDLLDALALLEAEPAAATPVVEIPAPRTLSSANLLRRRTSTTRRVVSDFDVRRLASMDVPTRSAKRTRKAARHVPNEPSQEPLADLLARHRAQPPNQIDDDISFPSNIELPAVATTRRASDLLPSPSSFPEDGPSSAPAWPSFKPRFLPSRSNSFDTDEDSDEGSDLTSNGSFSLSPSESGSFEAADMHVTQSRQTSELDDALRTISDMKEPESDTFSTSIAGLPVRKSDVRESSTVTNSVETIDDGDVLEESEFPDLASRVFKRAYAKHSVESGADILYGAKRFAERERNNGMGARPQWSIWPFHSAEENASLRMNSVRSHTRGESGTIRGRR
eukprot:TRINITY_DN177_c0_g1_i1.p1 TRINITY_DN177_c0_g1~~TRINITY_DN177_c0_g1_i1.p1  ORF type:complete len:797 (-),score=119.84 TRINITY_DN177_c0_g1_i1:7720-10035(-)